MNKVTKISLLVGAAVGALGAPMASYAADAAPGASTVQEVVVTANKRNEKLKDVAQSVTAISGAQLDIKQAVHFEDYVATVPGFTLVSAQPGESRLVIDGINAGGVSATVGTYVDETPYGSVTGLSNGAVLAPDFDTFDLSSIEVLRGPQGTLYGADSLGGVLKMVTTPPDPSGFAAKVELDGETTEGGGDSGSARALVNVPLGADAAIRASGFYTDEAGYISDPSLGTKDINGTRYEGGRFSFLYHPTDKFTLRLTAFGQDLASNGSSVEDLNPATLQPLYGDLTQSRTFTSPNDVSYRVYNMTANYNFGPANLLSSTSYATLHQSTNEDATALYGPLLSGAFGTPLGAGETEELNQDKFTQEIRLSSSVQKLEWQVGGFFTHEQNSLYQDLSGISLVNPPQVAPGFGGLALVSLPSTYTEYAAFANVDYHFTDQFDISVGGRYSTNNQTESETTSGPLEGPTSTVSGKSSDNVFTFAVAPKYKLNDDVTLYARVSSGWRPGGPNALNPLAPAAVPRTFAPDSLIDYTAGVKADLFDKHVYADVSAFYIDWSKIQLLADVDNFGVNSNGNGARSEGFEGTVDYVPFSGLTLSANGAYTDAYLTAPTPAIVGGTTGETLPYSARYTGALNADYSWSVMDDIRPFIGGSVRYVGDRRADFNSIPLIGDIVLPSYTTVDLRAGFSIQKYRVELYAKNLTDSHGILSIGGYGSTPNNAVQAGITRPRTIGVLLSAAY
jgi:outer membrane receptor protein involved in Fe transport